MKKVLILGAGMVSKPIVDYLLSKSFQVSLADKDKFKADAIIKDHPAGIALKWHVENEAALDVMISQHDIVVSLLPYIFHTTVAKFCIKNKKNMVTTSYVKPEMKALDKEAKEAGIIILNELGLDPGIDHMSAMRIIDYVHDKGGSIDSFYSLCGALPAIEAADNPFKYKFSWSPKGVVMAGNNDAQFLLNGSVVSVPTEDLFKNPKQIDFPEVGSLEVYPNRDSLPYIELYGIPETKTIMRGTFRYKGWCETLDAMKALGLITNESKDFNGKTFGDFIALMIGAENSSHIKEKAASFLNVSTDSIAIKAIEWLGLFEDTPMNRTIDTPFEITSDLMMEKMMLGTTERDMVAMQHIFEVSYPDGKKEVIKSRMLDFGSQETDTAVARTVALPAAIGVEMILNGEITIKGVHIPVIPNIYNPILDRLGFAGIKMIEDFNLPVSEKF